MCYKLKLLNKGKIFQTDPCEGNEVTQIDATFSLERRGMQVT